MVAPKHVKAYALNPKVTISHKKTNEF